MSSRDEAVCKSLAEAMRNQPEIFNGLELEYIINGQRSSRRQVQVTGSDIRRSMLYGKLVNMPSTTSSTTRYLNSDDVKQLTYESTRNVLASVVSDSDYVSTGDDVSVSSLIERELTRLPVSSALLEGQVSWDAVYWDPLWARPDMLTSYLNKVVVKDEQDNSSLILTEESRSQVIQPTYVVY